MVNSLRPKMKKLKGGVPQQDRFSKWESNSPYFYKATIQEWNREKAVYDGDTIKNIFIDLGFGVQIVIPSVRLIGINSPEMRGANKLKGEEARAFLENLLSEAAWEFYVKSYRFKTEKFGRYLFEIFVDKKNVNLMMVKSSKAIVNFYDGT
jgi:endonuclease YncB( thermonuclease family)